MVRNHCGSCDKYSSGIQYSQSIKVEYKRGDSINLFTKAKLVKILIIEDHETRYDIITDNHGHFKCEECGTIFNFAIRIDDFVGKELGAFEIKTKDVYFAGICPKCIKDIKERKQEGIKCCSCDRKITKEMIS